MGPCPQYAKVAICRVELSNLHSPQNGPQNAPKYAIRDQKIKKKFWGGTVPLPRPLPQWDGDTPFPCPTPIVSGLWRASILSRLRRSTNLPPPQIQILDPPLRKKGTTAYWSFKWMVQLSPTWRQLTKMSVIQSPPTALPAVILDQETEWSYIASVLVLLAVLVGATLFEVNKSRGSFISNRIRVTFGVGFLIRRHNFKMIDRRP